MSDVIDDDDTDALAAEFVLGTLDADERTHANLLLDIDDDFRGKVRVWERRLGELHLMVEPVEPAPQIWERIKIKVGGALLQTAVAPEPAPSPEPEQAAEEGADTEETLETTLDALEAELRKVGLSDRGPSEAAERPPELFPDRAEHDIERPFDVAEERQPDAIARDRRGAATRERPVPYLAPEVAGDLRPALRRWRAVAVMMTVLVLAVGGLLAAWRYAPERLPSQLRATNLLHIDVAPPATARPKAPPESEFDE